MIEERERGFLLENSRVVMKSSVENIEVGDYRIEKLAEGQSVDLPRWVAEELVSLNLAEMTEEPFEAELFRALSREKMMGMLQLSTLPQDFYLRMKRRLSFLAQAVSEGRAKREEVDRLRTGSYDLIGMRLSKLLSLSSSSSQGTSLTDRLTPEEDAFFSVSQSLSKEWRAALLGSAT
jgi:hypothetical protein